ncbi:MAG: cation:proton antiporter [Pseudomonadota bacterium]|nr:cation:proton antiporter [Pseudomonadota bacterium]
MIFALWYAIIGALLITMAISGSLLQRLPLSTAMLYLAIGFGLGPAGLGLLDADPFGHTELFERLSEIAVIISLFVTGLKLSVPMRDARWYLPLRLATVSMVMTIALITVTGMLGLGLSLGAAVLLGSILAPTDPVLASDVQVEDAGDRDRMRFSLSGEGGLNDGVAFPFVMLGLGLLGLHELGAWGWKWIVVDVIWGICGGLAIGGTLGYLLGKLVIYLRVHHREALGLDEFLALGLIALAYGAALLAHTLGFVAVFAAGLALRRIEEQPTDNAVLHEALQEASSNVEHPPTEAEDVVATDPEHATSYMTHAMLGFNEQLERIGEITVVLIIGAMLSYTFLPPAALWFAPLLFLFIRPVSVWLGLLGSRSTREQRWLTSWFGIRGIGSIYYLMYAINHGLEPALAQQLVAITLIVVSASIVVHGISVTPLMRRYARRAEKRASTTSG